MAKTNKKICIKTKDGSIQTITLYDDKNDVLKNGATNYLVVHEGRRNWGGLAALGDLNHPKASKLRYGNKAVLMNIVTKTINLNNEYKMSKLYPRIYKTMNRIPDEDTIEFVTGNRRDLKYMFDGCFNLISAPLFDTSNVINMNSMFYECQSLTSVPLFNTSSVTDMSYMFDSCLSLTSVPQFDTSSVIDMKHMFSNCRNLKFVPVFDIRNVKDIMNIFYETEITSVTFKNKPTDLEVDSQILCGDPSQIETIKFI